MQAEEPIKAELQKRFDYLTFDSLKKMREKNEAIHYCSWLLQGESAGVYTSAYDLKTELLTPCEDMARGAIDRMLDKHIDEQSTKIDDLANLDLEFPEWLLADMKTTMGEPGEIDALQAQSAYLKKLGDKISLAAPQLITAVDGYFDKKVWRVDAVISSDDSCKAILANLAPKRPGDKTRDDIYAHCVQQANDWLMKTQPIMIAALTDKLKTLNVYKFIPAEPSLCHWTM